MEKKKLTFGEFDFVTIKTEYDNYVIQGKGSYTSVSDILVEIQENNGHEDLFLTADDSAVMWIKLRWNRPLPQKVKILGDKWERGYGDFEWRGMCVGRFMPWYFLVSGEDKLWGYGVKVRPSAMCCWQADPDGITLILDVRCGGKGVLLHGRKLKMAELVSMEAEIDKNNKGRDTFHAAQEFCRIMCTDAILPEFPVYGSNNWYYAYGSSSEEEILSDTDYLCMLTQGAENPPYMVIDDGWQEHHRLDDYNGGPWRYGNQKFPDMKGLADKLTLKGVRPGLWVRLLQNEDESIPVTWRLPLNQCLDPSHPDALEYIKQDIKRICTWGYTLIKHDFSTYDLFGRWGFEMNPLVTESGWHFYNRSMTSAEVVKTLYQAIYDASKPYNALILGCNTIGHLGAGRMHLSRTGDDTSGLTWDRTRRMGVNTLAFRLPQHNAFFAVDADCVGIAGNIPWKFNRQWADVLAESGTPLFISARPGSLNQKEIRELQTIFQKASTQEKHKIPEDWMDSDCPRIWTDKNETVEYHWVEDAGPDFHSNENLYHMYIPVS